MSIQGKRTPKGADTRHVSIRHAFQGFAHRNSDPLPFNQYVTHERAVQGVGVGCPTARVDASNGNRDGCCLNGFTGLFN
jgi:hypothetical protein